MSEMVERVARAINPITMGWPDDGMVVRAKNNVRRQARAAIEAMLELTDGMVDAGYHRAKPYLGTETMAQAYRAMITAALGEGE